MRTPDDQTPEDHPPKNPDRQNPLRTLPEDREFWIPPTEIPSRIPAVEGRPPVEWRDFEWRDLICSLPASASPTVGRDTPEIRRVRAELIRTGDSGLLAEFESEVALNRLMDSMPRVRPASNFTSRVLNEIERQSKEGERGQTLHPS